MEESKILEDMILVLLYIFSWREKVNPNLVTIRSWKGYSFDVLDKLEENGYISSSRRAKSVIINEKGLEKARELKETMLAALANMYENSRKRSCPSIMAFDALLLRVYAVQISLDP